MFLLFFSPSVNILVKSNLQISEFKVGHIQTVHSFDQLVIIISSHSKSTYGYENEVSASCYILLEAVLTCHGKSDNLESGKWSNYSLKTTKAQRKFMENIKYYNPIFG